MRGQQNVKTGYSVV